MPTVFCAIELLYKIPNRIFLDMRKPLHAHKSRAMLLPVIRQAIIRTMGLKKCNNEPLHGEKRHRKTEAFVNIQMVARGENFGSLKILARLFFQNKMLIFAFSVYSLHCIILYFDLLHEMGSLTS